eukprot:scaffold35387_cov124-Skeletonema_marinoi.AAC.2
MEEAEEQQQQQPQQQQQRRRRRQQQQVIPIKYHCGGCPRGRPLTSPSMKGDTVKQKRYKMASEQSCSRERTDADASRWHKNRILGIGTQIGETPTKEYPR